MNEISIECGIGAIKALQWGEGHSKKILALHGWLDNAASFYQLAPQLEKLGYEVIAIDFVGHGHSVHRADNHFVHFVEYVLDIQEVINQLKWHKPILLGHSMGAAMAVMYAASYPECIDKLIMIENVGPVPAYEKFTAASNLRESLRQWQNHTTQHKYFYKNIDQALKARQKATPMAKEFILPMVERGLISTKKGYHWSTDKRLRLRSLFRFAENIVEDILSVKKPETQLILAQPNTYALSYKSVNSRIEKLKPESIDYIDGGHHLHMDNSDAVFKAIKSFLKKHE